MPVSAVSVLLLTAYDPWVCLAAIAAATTQVRIGTTVTPLPAAIPGPPRRWRLTTCPEGG